MDELLNLIIFGALILVSTLFGGKKKPRTGVPPSSGQPRQQPPPPSATPHRAPQPVAESRPVRAEPAGKPESFRDLFELLQQQAEAAVNPPAPILVEDVPDPGPDVAPPTRSRDRTQESIETLVPAGGASHVAFHSKFIQPLEPPPVRRPPQFTLPRNPVALKRAVIWSEILGSPKGLD